MKHIGKIAFFVAVFGALFVALMLFGARLGLLEPIAGFRLYRTFFNPLAAVIAGVGALALIIHSLRKEKSSAIAGGIVTLFGLVCLVPLISSTLNPPVRSAPINDVSTDTAQPPAFEVLRAASTGAPNSTAQSTPDLAEIQAAAYPDIAPLETDMSEDAAYDRALQVANDLGWEIVASDAENRRIEAIARTSVFYFADDVVVVVSPQADGSRVDMRSVSRVGRSDQGVNAARIRTFQQKFGA